MHPREHQSISRHPLTQEQKQRLITVYQRTGNMSKAMRDSGIHSSRTAYLWWNRFVEEGEMGLLPRSHARKTQQTISEGVAGSVRELRQVHPAWGRRRIAEAVASLYGKPIISPAGVEAVLLRAKLWKPDHEVFDLTRTSPGQESGWMEHGRPNEEALLALIHRGLARSLVSDAEGARQVLQNHLWSPQQDQPVLWNLMRRCSNVGQWLLRSRAALGHSLMNTGRWEQAAGVLAETLTWIRENEAWLRQQRWGDEGSCNLRWGDAWVECMQYLAIVLQEADYQRAQAYLATALIGLQRQWKPVVPKTPSAMLSNVKRDIASLKIKSGRIMGHDIEQELSDIVSGVDSVHLVPGKLAGISILWAKLRAGRAKIASTESYWARVRELDRMEQAVEQTLILVQQDPSPMLQANFISDAALLYQEHGMHIDAALIRRAAQYCLAYGYRREAGQLLELPAIGQFLTEEDLHRLIRLLR